MRVQPETPKQPDVISLIAELDAYQDTLYPAEARYALDLTALAQENVLFVVARDEDGAAIGCGAVVLEGESGELKRMFVRPAHRARGAAAKVLKHLEAEAGKRGCRLLRLETGPYQPEALAFYEKHGFKVCGAFGTYPEHPLSVFMQKKLGGLQFAPLIKEIGRGTKGARDMDAAQAEALFGAILDGQVPDMELGAILLSMRIKGESEIELAGFVAAMQARTAVVHVPAGPRCVLLPTFNGARKQANLMPLVALLLAREGVPVLMFGRHDFDSRESPFALLEALGLPLAATVDEAGVQLASTRIAALPLAALNPGLDALMALRPRLGVRNSGHSVAKLLDAAPGRSVRVVAVTHPEYLDSMGRALLPLTAGGGRALLMRASEGEAYAHLRRRAQLYGFADGQRADLHPADTADIDWQLNEACDAAANAALIRAVLAGEAPLPPRIAEQVQALAKLARD